MHTGGRNHLCDAAVAACAGGSGCRRQQVARNDAARAQGAPRPIQLFVPLLPSAHLVLHPGGVDGLIHREYPAYLMPWWQTRAEGYLQ